MPSKDIIFHDAARAKIQQGIYVSVRRALSIQVCEWR